jgi:predicted NAD/FAD-dependent oxidoreductase
LKTLVDPATVQDSPIRFQTKALRVDRNPAGPGYRVSTESHGVFHAPHMILSAPMPQNLDLLKEVLPSLDPSLVESLRSVVYAPCFALYFIQVNPESLSTVLDAESKMIRSIHNQKAKGLGIEKEAMVVHAREDWSEKNWNRSDLEIQGGMMDELKRLFPDLVCSDAGLHRWRFSRPKATLPGLCLRADSDLGGSLVFVGDGFGDASLESAYRSGVAGAERIPGLSPSEEGLRAF